MAITYPSDLGKGDIPFVVFRTHRAAYEPTAGGSGVKSIPTGAGVALYMPTNVAFNDSLRYEGVSTGLIGAAFSRMSSGQTEITMDDIQAVAMQNAEGIAGAAGAALSNALGGGAIATGISGITGASVVGNVKAEVLKDRQRTMNPREFMLFKAPVLRQFAFNYTFIPKDAKEARSVPEIIKFFRRASYPALHSGGIDYVFPDAFSITFGRSGKMIKIPEVVCIGISVVYNPNSMSYFEKDNLPVEISLQLSFQELQPIDQSMVDQGY
jgi:hypothetical protein